jgi:signal transduction histidine kinase/DNA-binding NarL/FixJ family response regulator
VTRAGEGIVVSERHGTLVLLVEDNPGDADLVRISLDDAEGGSFEAEHVTTLAAALAAVAGPRRPDVILLDLSLPDAFALEGLRRLKEAAPEVPVVVLTGSTGREIGRAAIQAGAQDYLTKGDDTALVPRALRYAIARHAQADRARLLAEERAARAEAEAARERMAVLAAATKAVSHSLDDRHALASLASALVPRFAEWCAIRTEAGETDGGPWSVAHRDGPSSAAAVSARLDALAAAGEAARRAAALAAGGEAELHEPSPGAAPSTWSRLLEELGARSGIVAQIRLADEALGVVVFGASQRRFTGDDVALAEEIARRAGVAIANCRLYREARLAVAARDEFLSVAAHELRTPIAALQLKLQHVEAKQQASLCGTCEHAVPADYRGAVRQISRLSGLVETMLDVSRIVARRVTLEREDLDLCEVARAAIEDLREVASRSRSTVALRCAGPVRGAWDRAAMERVLANLLSNALKFGAEKPVEVRVVAEGDLAVVEVEDHGIGIPPEKVDRIFDQFERAVSSRHFGGLGLGLYVTRRLVEQHGGTVTVSSRPGAGSLFTLRVPRAEAPPAVGAR